ncbi:hypothetical protein [Amycolatopsis magusensis]
MKLPAGARTAAAIRPVGARTWCLGRHFAGRVSGRTISGNPEPAFASPDRSEWMSSFKVRPSKPAAIFGAIFGVAILVFGLVSNLGKSGGFLWLWVVAGVAIIAFNLWAAFSRNGATEVVERRER